MAPTGKYNIIELSTGSTVGLSTAVLGPAVADLSAAAGLSVSGPILGSYMLIQDDGGGVYRFALSANRDTGSPQGFLGAVPMLYTGSVAVRQRTPTTFKTFATVASSSAVVVWTPTSGTKFRLMGYVVGCSSAGDVILQDSTAAASATPVTIFRVPTGGTATLPSPAVTSGPMGNGILSASTNNVLTVTPPTTSATLSGTVWGTEE